MDTNKHTEGPWIFGAETGVDSTRIETESGEIIGAIRTRKITQWEQSRPIYSWDDEGHANARLIAAAPGLLDALNDQLGFLNVLAGTIPLSEKDTHRRISIKQEELSAAIAKATGSAA